MDIFEIIQNRRSIRKYLPKRVERDKLETIAAAGVYAPNPGGRQGTKIIIVDDAEAIETLGVINANCENRNWSFGVSQEQPSIIDDLSIRSGFYGCPALAIICVPKANKAAVNAIGSAFVCAENIALQAYALGVGSCIVGRAEATFSDPTAQAFLARWGLAEDDTPLVFVCLGYVDGAYPRAKPRQEGRMLFSSRD